MHSLLASKDIAEPDQPIKSGLVSFFDFFNSPTPQKYHDIDFNQVMVKIKLTDPTKKQEASVDLGTTKRNLSNHIARITAKAKG